MYVKSMVFVAITCSLFLSGCGTLPFLNKTPKIKPDKPIPLENFDAEARISVHWSKKVGKGLGRKSIKITPAIVADRVVAADAYGLVQAFDRFNGSRLWDRKIGTPLRKNLFNPNDRRDTSHLSGGVGAGEGKIFVGTIRGELFALDVVSGQDKWKTSLSSEILAPPTVGRDLVVLNTNDGKLFALDHETGDQVWVFTSQEPIITLRGTASPILDAGIAYSGFASGMIAAIDIDSGALIWDQRISDPEGTSELDRIVDVDGQPLLTRQLVVAGSHQGAVRAIRRGDGSILWEAQEPTHQNLASGYRLIYVITDNSDVVALDEETGQEVWRQSSFLRRELSAPLAFGNYLIFGDLEGYVHVLAQSDGRLMARRKLGSGAIRSSFVHEDGMVYCLGDNGKLTAFEIDLNS